MTLPDKDGEPSIPHPHVVIRIKSGTVTVCGITTNVKKVTWPGNLLLKKGEANLEKLSIVDVSQISEIPKDQLGEFIGTLAPDRMKHVLSGIRFRRTLLQEK